MFKPRADLNPLGQADNLDAHQQITLWYAYQSALTNLKLALIIFAMCALGCACIFVVWAIDSRQMAIKVEQAQQRQHAAEQRVLDLVDVLNADMHKQ